MSESDGIFNFPCDFPIKVMARAGAKIESFIKETLRAKVKNLKTIQCTSRLSKDGRYESVTAIFEAESKEQLDELYVIFSQHPDVKMVL